ncbi:MAG: hypothetical protein KME42_16225 [Tildeniella nuda ZEHNDER 1965/U140]|nr:hypothetical protein [Tildeniella nuda ZEHNDER 1965/U140]
MTFIRLADLIINTECIATVRLSAYAAADQKEDIPLVNLCLMLPEGSVDGQTRVKAGHLRSVEKLEFEGDLALAIWNYFLESGMVQVLFD